jgi:hypothetical protein
MTTRITKLGLASAGLLAALLPGCSAAPEPSEPGATGTLAMALQATGSQGGVYGLRGTFVLDDPQGMQASVDPSDPSTVLTFSPQVGSYSLELCAGGSTNAQCQGLLPWRLYSVACTGPGNDPAPVEHCAVDPVNYLLEMTPVFGAVLSSPNPQGVDIALNQTTHADFQFYVPGEGTVNFARGTLNVTIDVGEGFPAGHPCSTAVECESHVCTAIGSSSTCQEPTCDDGVQNGGEAGPDCGGPCPNPCPTQCTSDAECGAAEACVNGECLPTGGSACNDTNDCPTGSSCIAGVCQTGCTSDADCPEGLSCNAAGECSAQSSCTSNADCPTDSVCNAAGECVVQSATCTSDADCAAGSTCFFGLCFP